MEIELLRGSHSFGECNYHLQFTPKYRRDIFTDGFVKTLCADSFRATAAKLRIVILAVEFGPDHTHIFVGGCKNFAPSELARRFKGASSRLLRKVCWEKIRNKLWGESFWSDGYFYRSVGAVTSETVKYYVENAQQKHWTGLDYGTYKQHKEDGQTALTRFLSEAHDPRHFSGG
jgi:putative transposase